MYASMKFSGVIFRKVTVRSANILGTLCNELGTNLIYALSSKLSSLTTGT